MAEPQKIESGDPVRKLSGRYLKWTAYGLFLLLMCLLQAAPYLIPEIFGARPLLVVPTVVFIAMFTGPIGGAAAGIAGGLLWDLYSDRLLGFNAIVLLIICCACGLLVRLLIRNNLPSALLLAAGALLFQGLMDWFFNYVLLRGSEPWYMLLHLTLPNALYTLILSPLLYGLTRLIAHIPRKRE